MGNPVCPLVATSVVVRTPAHVLYSPHVDQATKEAFATMIGTVERRFAAIAEDIAALRTELKGDIATLGIQVSNIEHSKQSAVTLVTSATKLRTS
jgi:hypothetical protein